MVKQRYEILTPDHNFILFSMTVNKYQDINQENVLAFFIKEALDLCEKVYGATTTITVRRELIDI